MSRINEYLWAELMKIQRDDDIYHIILDILIESLGKFCISIFELITNIQKDKDICYIFRLT